jgi:two-component system, OmpR family, sensor kinase
MRTTSLRRRVALFASAVFVVSVLLVDLSLTVMMRSEFDREVQRAMQARVALVEALDDGRSAEAVGQALAAGGVPAVLVAPDGTRVDTGRATGLPDEPHEVAIVDLSDGTRVEVIVSRASSDAAQRRVLAISLGGAAVAVAAILAMFWTFTARLLRPLDEVIETARAIAHGRSGARLTRELDGTSLSGWGTDTELGRLATAFDEMLDAQEGAIRAAQQEEGRSRRFLADAAHQLRTPVAGIRAASEALLHDPTTPDRDRLLAHLARESARTGRLLERLLRVAELDRGEQRVPSRFDLVRLVRDEVDRQRPLAPQLALGLTGPETLAVTADEDGLREALANLLDNARRHARSRVDLEVTEVGDTVVVRVGDDGPGLAPGTEAAVFERFVSLDDRGGSGLGLPIARSIARAQGGDVRWTAGRFELSVARTPPGARSS